MFVGRKEELNELSKYLNGNKQENIIIYGRRWIGKSELIKEALKNTNKLQIFYQATETSELENIKSLSKIISNHFNLGNIIFVSFEDIFISLLNQEKEPIFVIDEYPYLRNLSRGLDSVIQKSIDTYKSTSKIKIVLLGSYIDIMSKLDKSDRPLFGRIDKTIFLSEMNYYEASNFYPNADLETKIKYYSVFGGVPYFNSFIDENKSFEENVKALIISNSSPLSNYVELILSKELRKIENANNIFLAIARGVSKFNDILSNLTISSSGLSHVLNSLITMDLIKKTIPINEPNNSKRTHYQINDNYIDFFYKYIYKNQTERSLMNVNDFYDELVKDNLEEYFIPKKFEGIAKQYLTISNKESKIAPPLHKIGKYWYDNPVKKVNGEFDLVSLDKNGYIIYEVKYSKNKIDDKVVNHLIKQLKLCGVNYYNLGFFSKTGFDLKDQNNYYLKTLKDLYNI